MAKSLRALPGQSVMYDMPLPLWIRTNGDVLTITPKGDRLTLEEMQEYVGGYVEPVPIPDSLGAVMLADEDGTLKGLEYNPKATGLAGRLIVGDVVVISEHDFQ